MLARCFSGAPGVPAGRGEDGAPLNPCGERELGVPCLSPHALR